MSDVTERSSVLSGDRPLVLVVLFLGIVGSGLARYFLGNAGYPTIGSLVFVAGYAGMVLVLYFGWLRGMELTGPGGR